MGQVWLGDGGAGQVLPSYRDHGDTRWLVLTRDAGQVWLRACCGGLLVPPILLYTYRLRKQNGGLLYCQSRKDCCSSVTWRWEVVSGAPMYNRNYWVVRSPPLRLFVDVVRTVLRRLE